MSIEAPDIRDLVTHEHRVIDGLVASLGEDRADRLMLAHRLVDELAVHAAAGVQVLYPALRDIVPGGSKMANAGQETVKKLRAELPRIEDGHPGDVEFEAALTSVVEELGRHVPVEENEFLPALQAVIGTEAMAELGRIYASVREATPTGTQGLPPSASDPWFSPPS